MSAHRSPILSRARSLAVALLPTLVFIGAAEVCLRLLGVAEPVRPRILLRSMDMDVSFPFMQTDPELFWSLRPGFAGEFQRTLVSINSLGLRGPEVRAAKPPGRRRIVCFGDSITFGFGVSDDEAYPACLERSLSDLGIDVVNAGVTGYTSHQVLGGLRRLVPKLGADLATICVGWNDGNERGINDRDYARRIRTAVAMEEMLNRSYIYRAMKGAFLRLEARRVRRGGLPATAAARSSDPSGKGARVPIAEYRENLAAMVAVCRAHGIRPVFIALPLRCRAGEPPRESPYPQALRSSAQGLGVPFVRLSELEAEGDAVDNQAAFIDAIHFSPQGNERVARLIAEQLRAQGLVP